MRFFYISFDRLSDINLRQIARNDWVSGLVSPVVDGHLKTDIFSYSGHSQIGQIFDYSLVPPKNTQFQLESKGHCVYSNKII